MPDEESIAPVSSVASRPAASATYQPPATASPAGGSSSSSAVADPFGADTVTPADGMDQAPEAGDADSDALEGGKKSTGTENVRDEDGPDDPNAEPRAERSQSARGEDDARSRSKDDSGSFMGAFRGWVQGGPAGDGEGGKPEAVDAAAEQPSGKSADGQPTGSEQPAVPASGKSDTPASRSDASAAQAASRSDVPAAQKSPTPEKTQKDLAPKEIADRLMKLPTDQKKAAVGEMGAKVGEALKGAKSPEEAVRMMSDFQNLVGAMGLDPKDPAVTKSMQPLVDAFKDPRLQQKFKGASVDHFNALTGYLRHITSVSPAGNFYTRFISGSQDKMVSSFNDHQKAVVDFRDKVDSGHYQDKPEDFLKDYMGMHDRLDGMRAEAEQFAADTNKGRGNMKTAFTVAASLPAIPFGVGTATAASALAAGSITYGSGGTAKEAAVDAASAAVGNLVGFGIFKAAGPVLGKALGETAGSTAAGALSGAGGGLAGAQTDVGLKEGRLLTKQEAKQVALTGGALGGALGFVFKGAKAGKPGEEAPGAKPVEEGGAPGARAPETSSPETAPSGKAASDVADVLKMTPKEFAESPDAQRRLFEAARAARDNQNSEASKILNDLGFKDGEAKSILKRDDFSEFTAGVKEKLTRPGKNYTQVSNMGDVVRGRFNMQTHEQAEAVVKELAKRFPGARIEEPRGHYPRYHVDVVDPKTGLRHEWQVGTKATTQFLETNSVPVPAGMDVGAGHNNFHDIWYDHMLQIKDPAVRAQLGVDDFGKRYTQLLMETAGGTPAGFQQRYQQLSGELGGILARMQKEMPGYFESLSHK